MLVIALTVIASAATHREAVTGTTAFIADQRIYSFMSSIYLRFQL